jgi:hypothetical protein
MQFMAVSGKWRQSVSARRSFREARRRQSVRSVRQFGEEDVLADFTVLLESAHSGAVGLAAEAAWADS